MKPGDRPEAVGRRAVGRPRSAERSGTVSTWLPARYHDLLIARARLRDDNSVSAAVRQLLILGLKRPPR